MKLVHSAKAGFVMASVLALAACSSAVQPARSPETTSTTQLTSAMAEPPPRVGKSQRALDDAAQDAIDPKTTTSRHRVEHKTVFGDWK